MNDNDILQKRYYFLYYIWECKGITCPFIKLLLTGMNYMKQKKTITKELKVVTSWDQNDTQSSTVNDCCTTNSSIAKSIVPSIAKRQELNIIEIPKKLFLKEFGGNQLEKLKILQKVIKKENVKKENIIGISNNENNISPISKNNCDINEKIESNFLFIYPYSYNYDEEEKVTNKFNELYGRECTFNNTTIEWTNPIKTYTIK